MTPETKSVATLERIERLLHPAAREELRRGDTSQRVIDWLRARFEQLAIGDEDRVTTQRNAWNETHGLGLQSVSVCVERPDACGCGLEFGVINRFGAQQWKHPTIGIVAPGLVEPNDGMGLAAFGVDAGKAERIISLSDGLVMGSTPVSAVSRNSVIPARLSAGEVVQIDGPNAALTLIELKNPTPDQIRDAVNHGVYACEFLQVG